MYTNMGYLDKTYNNNSMTCSFGIPNPTEHHSSDVALRSLDFIQNMYCRCVYIYNHIYILYYTILN